MLQDKTVFITGGARGLGLGIARACAQEGARIALADLDADALEEAKATFGPDVEVRTYQLDVADRARFLQVADEVEADLGPVHALFNNAGVIDSVAPAAMRGELWDWMVDVNLNGVYNGVQAFVPRMIQRKQGGYVVNTSSGAGLAASTSGFAYHATKYAVVGLSESLRLELARHSIGVSVVCPGAVATSIVQNTLSSRPADAEAHTSKITQILGMAHEALLSYGVPPEEAGRAVVDGMLAGQPFIFTDGGMRESLEARHAAILACLPATESALAAIAD